jgi:hypothetical protein
MDKAVRTQKIQNIVDNNKNDPFGKMEIPWMGKLDSMEVYLIPLDILVYNKYNGRILSRTKSLEKQGQLIDPETPEGKAKIEKLLWDSNSGRNDKTLKNISVVGQQKVGIITKDGIIIDGNRRAMLLNKIQADPKYSKKFDYFKAVVLPITVEENPIEIEKLETSFQMGEDEKLGYNATEKYIKAKEIYLRLAKLPEINLKELNDLAINQIADWMGESNSEIRKYLSTIAVMDDYLSYLEYDGIYTQLDDREDQFLSLQKWLSTFYDKESNKAFDGYTNLDVDDLRDIAFDYIRIRQHYDGKIFRDIAEGNRDKHFFGDKKIWDSFRDRHFEIKNNLSEEAEIDFDSSNLEAHLNDRDNKFFKSANDENGDNKFIENLRDNKYKIGYNKAADEPGKLVKRTIQTFDAIKTGHKAFASEEVQNLVKELGDKVFDTLQKKSSTKVLDHIIRLLSEINVDEIPENEIEDIKAKTKQIQSLGYNINKSL